jgi:hypothetical protein
MGEAKMKTPTDQLDAMVKAGTMTRREARSWRVLLGAADTIRGTKLKVDVPLHFQQDRKQER